MQSAMLRNRSTSINNKIGDLAVWPDKVRRDPLSFLFERAGSKTPKALKDYSTNDTSNWHFVNAIFIDDKHALFFSRERQKADTKFCKLNESGELYNVWPHLLSAFQESKEPAQQGVILAFVLHLAADAFQPLHVLSKVNDKCEHDRGGNFYCVDPPTGFSKSAKRCEMNLHRLWDQGFTVFEGGKELFRGPIETNKLSVDFLFRNPEYLTKVYPTHPKNIASVEYKEQSYNTVSTLSHNAVIFLQNTLTQMAAEYRASRGK